VKDSFIGPFLIQWGCATNAELGLSYLPAFWGALSLYYLMVIVLSGLPLMLASFPTGRGVTPRWDRIMKGLTLAFMGVGFLSNLSAPAAYGLTSPSPLAVKSLVPYHFITLGIYTGLLVILLSLAAALMIYRYRVARETERKQLRWLLVFALYMVLISAVGPTIVDYETEFGKFVNAVTALLLFALPPISVSFAILRHRLWDIDVIIRRTLQYGVLTGLLALVYFGVVIVGQQLASSLTGSPESPLVVVISTLVVASLFNPLRKRVQAFIDRRFYRRKYDATQILTAFTETARDETQLDRLAPALLEAVQDSLQPEQAWLWLKR
jgi:hypothetical protein